MKTYYKYHEEILSEELKTGLVGFGLFAEKIPNFLTSEEFSEYYNALESHPSPERKDYIRYWNMRNINIPRPLAIPEPFAYASQVKQLSDNWVQIKKYFKDKTINDKFKISRIHIRKMINKPILFEMNYKNFSKDGEPENDIVIRSRYIVKADISNCFNSIYSHSIAWALVGKEEAKLKSKPQFKGEWYNKLDFHTQNVKHGETNGILIGPHASNLISEIILVNIDHEMTNRGYSFIRNIDDYTCYVDSYETAEKFLIDLSEELKKFELSLNTKKSEIKPLPQANVKNWVTKLNHFIFPYVQKQPESHLRLKVLKGFLDYAIELMLDKESDGAILNYAIKVLANRKLDDYAVEYYFKQVHHLVLLYPYLVVYLKDFVFEPHSIQRKEIKALAIDIYKLGIEKRNYEACSYAIYWAMHYNFRLGINSVRNDALNSMDCIFMLISYLYHCKRSTSTSTSHLKSFKDKAIQLKDVEFERYWLFIYEILPAEELNGFYKNMKKKKVTFIKKEFLSKLK